MFCPKCGAQLPDTATFCSSCGNQLQQRVQSVQQPAPGAYGGAYGSAYGGAHTKTFTNPIASTSLGFTTLGIVGRVLILVALILLFMPIIAIPSMSMLSSYMGELSAYSSELARYGINMNDINMLMSGSYSALDLNTICQMAAKMDPSSSSGYYSLMGYIIAAGLFLMAALLVVGLLMSFLGTKSTKVARVGGIVVAGMAISEAIGLLAANAYIQQEMARTYGSYGLGGMGTYFTVEVPITVWLLFLCAIAGFIVLQMDAQQQLNGAVEYPDPLAVGSIASFCAPVYGIIVAIVAIVRNKDARNKRLAIIGLVVCIAVIVISILLGMMAK